MRVGEIEGLPIVFMSRHDKGHRLSPTDINYRANIDVMKRAGVTDLDLALGLRLVQGGAAAGHLRAGRPIRRPHPSPGNLVLRHGLRGACVHGASGLARACAFILPKPRMAEGIQVAREGTYVCMEGPQFSTLAESLTYKTSAIR